MTSYLKSLFRKNLSFFVPFSIIWLSAFVFSLMQTKAETHIMINSFNHPSADIFFKYFTHLGGAIPWVVIGVCIFYKYRVMFFLLTSQTLTALLTFILKNIFLIPRPSVLLNELGYNFHTIQGVTLHTQLSFPSGHTASAFALFFALSLLSKHDWQKATCLVVAFTAGFSRIYLSQHFLQDVLAGSIVGILAVILTAYWFINKQWGDGNIIKTISSNKVK